MEFRMTARQIELKKKAKVWTDEMSTSGWAAIGQSADAGVDLGEIA